MKVTLLQTHKALSPTSITLADYVINPYRGCEFGCQYCYSQYNKNISLRKNDWGNFVDVKINIPTLLKKEIEQLSKKPDRVLIGSVTEVFQPIDRKYLLMKKILEIMKEYNIPVTLLTKSTDIEFYLDALMYSRQNVIYFTYNSQKIKDYFERNTPPYHDRLRVVQNILNKGIKLIVYISPFFPFLTEGGTILEELYTLKHNEINVSIENYNFQMGSWDILKKKVDKNIIEEYKNIYKDLDSYQRYWNTMKKEIGEYNKRYNFKINFLIYPFNDYFKNEFN